MTPTTPKGIVTIRAKRPELLPTLDTALERLDSRTGGILAVRNQLSDTAWHIGNRLKRFVLIPNVTTDRYHAVRLNTWQQLFGRILGVRVEDIEIEVGLHDISEYRPTIFSVVNRLNVLLDSQKSLLNVEDVRTLFFVANLALQYPPTVIESLSLAIVFDRVMALHPGLIDMSDVVSLKSYLEDAQKEFLNELSNDSQSLEHAIKSNNCEEIAKLIIRARNNCWINTDLMTDDFCSSFLVTLASINNRFGEYYSTIVTIIDETITNLTSDSLTQNWEKVDEAIAKSDTLISHPILQTALDLEGKVDQLRRVRMTAFAAFFAYGPHETESASLTNLYPSLTSMMTQLEAEHRPIKSLHMLREFLQTREVNEVIRTVHKYPCKELIVDAVKALDFMLPTEILAEHIAKEDIWFLKGTWGEDHDLGLAAKIIADWYIPVVLVSLFEFPNDKWGNPLLSLGDSLRLGGRLGNISSESCLRILHAFDTVFPEHESLPIGFIVAVHADVKEIYGRIPASFDEACQMVRELYTRDDSIAGVGNGRALQDTVDHVLVMTSSDNARAFLANRYSRSGYFTPSANESSLLKSLGPAVSDNDKTGGAKLIGKFESEYKRIRERAEWKKRNEHIGQLAMQVVKHIRNSKGRLLSNDKEYCALPKYVGEIAGLPENFFRGSRLDKYEKYLVCRRVVLLFAPTTSIADQLSPILGYAESTRTGGFTLHTGRMQSFLSLIGLRYEIARDARLDRKQWVKPEEEIWLEAVLRL